MSSGKSSFFSLWSPFFFLSPLVWNLGLRCGFPTHSVYVCVCVRAFELKVSVRKKASSADSCHSAGPLSKEPPWHLTLKITLFISSLSFPPAFHLSFLMLPYNIMHLSVANESKIYTFPADFFWTYHLTVTFPCTRLHLNSNSNVVTELMLLNY